MTDFEFPPIPEQEGRELRDYIMEVLRDLENQLAEIRALAIGLGSPSGEFDSNPWYVDSETGYLKAVEFNGNQPGIGSPDAILPFEALSAFFNTTVAFDMNNQEVDEEHYLLSSRTFTGPNGKTYATIRLGPPYRPVSDDRETDSRTLDVTNVNPLIVSRTLLGNYPTPADATLSYGVRLRENIYNTMRFRIQVYQNSSPGGATPIYEDTVTLSGNAHYETKTIVAPVAMSQGDVISLYVEGQQVHPAGQGWVEGAVEVSYIQVSAG